MKEDYLWDKTGEDDGIEALENALKAFRFQENAPPALPPPPEVYTLEKQSWRRFFQLGFGFAAFAGLALVFSLAWLRFGSAPVSTAKIADRADELKTAGIIADDSFTASRAAAPPTATDTAPTEDKPVLVKAAPKRKPVAARTKSVARKPKVKEPAETLTAEERYAYNQLMLALSITGTQLKIVKDKVQGIEDRNAVVETTK